MRQTITIPKILTTINLLCTLSLFGQKDSVSTPKKTKSHSTRTKHTPRSKSKNLVSEIGNKSDLASNLPAVVEFYSPTCGGCTMFAKTYETLANQFPQIKFLKINGVNHLDLVKKYRIGSYPSFIFILNDVENPIETIVGGHKDKIINALKKLTETTTKSNNTTTPKTVIQNILSLAELEKLIKESKKPVVAEYHAEAWCSHCQIFAPVLSQIADEHGEEVLFVKIDDMQPNNKTIATKYGINALPTILIFKQGEPSKPISTVMGASKEKLVSAIKDVTAAGAKNTHAPQKNTDAKAVSKEAPATNPNVKIIDITSKSQLEQLIKNNQPLVVDYHAESWCGACKMYRDLFGALSYQYPQLQFAKIDHEQVKAEGLDKEYDIQGFPTTLIFENGKLTKKIVGVNMQELQSKFNELSTQKK